MTDRCSQATGSIKPSMPYFIKTVTQQAHVGVLLGTGLCGVFACLCPSPLTHVPITAGGFLRVYLTNGDVVNSIAISTSLFMIVMTSVLAGAALPFGLAKAGLDPANAGTTIQVLMDVTGVVITCVTCKLILDTLAHSL